MMSLAEFFCVHKVDLVKNIISRNMKLKFRRSYLGFFWSLLVPLGMSFAYMILFRYIMRLAVPHYLPFILFNIMTWSYFSVACMEGLETIVANHGILSKVPVPIHVFNFASIMTNAVYFFASFPVIILFIYMDGVTVNEKYILIPVFIAMLFLVTYFMSVLLGILFVYFRDLKHLFSVILQMWMYATPILYTVDMLPPKLHFLVYLNPITGIFVSIQGILFKNEWPTWINFGVAWGWIALLFFASYFIYGYSRNRVLENV